jgi:hypothetical protein
MSEEVEKSKGIFDHPFFKKAPAFAALERTPEPKPEHVRACLMELARYVLTKVDKLEKLDIRL